MYRELLPVKPSLLLVVLRAFSSQAIASSDGYRELLPVRPSLLPVGTESFFP
jgi:hypothetical protein